VDHNYDRLVEKLLTASKQAGESLESADGLIPPMAAIATHDRQRIDFAVQKLEMLGLPKQEVEFQMLYGIRRDLQDQLAQQGYPVRVYVPYGTHWYPYFMRRLAERPANLWFFINNFFKA
jgi:proline dehydrogenase